MWEMIFKFDIIKDNYMGFMIWVIECGWDIFKYGIDLNLIIDYFEKYDFVYMIDDVFKSGKLILIFNFFCYCDI